MHLRTDLTTLIVLCCTACCAIADEWRDHFLKNITLYQMVGAGPTPDALSGAEVIVRCKIDLTGREPAVVTFKFFYPNDGKRKEAYRQGAVQYPEVAVGDIVPLYDGQYRVTKIQGPPRYGGYVELERITPMNGETVIDARSWVLPIGFRDSKGIGWQQRCSVRVKNVVEGSTPGDEPQGMIVTIASDLPSAESDVEVRCGDVVTIGKYRLRVMKIVAPNPISGVIGWTEFRGEHVP